jgi:transcription elongation factor Elf1
MHKQNTCDAPAMNNRTTCPVCNSKNITTKNVRGINYLHCTDCGFDEEHDYDAAYPEERSTQRGKGTFTPYQRGGGQRTRK